MKKIIELTLKGKNKEVEVISLPTKELELKKQLVKIKENFKSNFEVFAFKIIDIEFEDIKYTITKDTDVINLNNWLLKDKRAYSILVACNFNEERMYEVLKNKNYIFLANVTNELDAGKKIKDLGLISHNINIHIKANYTQEGINYNYKNIFNHFKNKGMKILKNNTAVMILSEEDFNNYKTLLSNNEKEIISLDTEYSALEIACDRDLIKKVEDDSTIRRCSYCGIYTSYDEMHGEFKFNETIHYDICDRCCSLIELDITPDTLEEHYYDDYLDYDYINQNY